MEPITLAQIIGWALKLIARWLDIKFERSEKMKELKHEKLQEALDAADNLDPAALVRSVSMSVNKDIHEK